MKLMASAIALLAMLSPGMSQELRRPPINQEKVGLRLERIEALTAEGHKAFVRTQRKLSELATPLRELCG